MRNQKLGIILTVINLALLIFILGQGHPSVAQGVAPVLRGRELEIVDGQGRVRASIKVQPADRTLTVPNGQTYPETVILRLIDPNGRPSVKIAGSVQGAGLSFVGDSDSTYVVLKAEGADSSLKLLSKDGREQLVKP